MCWVLAVAAVEEVVSVAPVVAAAVAAQIVTVAVDVWAVVEQTDSQVFLADSGSC